MMITGIKELCYQERLKKLDLTTLETRRIRREIFKVREVFKNNGKT